MTLKEIWDSFLESNDNITATWLIGVLIALGVTLVALWFRQRSSRRLKRSWSFTSLGMAIGTFPEHVNVPDPIINAAIFFDQCPSKEALTEAAVKPMLEYERLSTIPERSGVVRPCRNVVQPSELVRTISISGDDQLVYDTILEHLQDSLTENRNDLPWWELLRIQNQGAGRSALVARIHHSLADGISLVSIFEKIITDENDQPIESLLGATANRASKANKSSWSWWSWIAAVVHVLTLGTTPYDDDTVFGKSSHGQMVYTGQRSCVIFPSVSLDFCKKLKNAAGVTINDILMTCVSQAIHDYCASQNCPVLEKQQPIQCRALLPVSLPRSPDELQDRTRALRNKWCLVSTDMAVGATDIMERLNRIHSSTKELKASPRAFVQLLIQNTLPPLLPHSVGQKTVYDVFTRHSLVFSNVPGPGTPCKLAGQVASEVQMFFSNLIPQIGLISYAGQVYGNIVLDHEAIPDSRSLARFYARAMVQLADRLLVVAPLELVEAAEEDVAK